MLRNRTFYPSVVSDAEWAFVAFYVTLYREKGFQMQRMVYPNIGKRLGGARGRSHQAGARREPSGLLQGASAA